MAVRRFSPAGPSHNLGSWSREEMAMDMLPAQAARLRADGFTIREIAAHLGISKSRAGRLVAQSGRSWERDPGTTHSVPVSQKPCVPPAEPLRGSAMGALRQAGTVRDIEREDRLADESHKISRELEQRAQRALQLLERGHPWRLVSCAIEHRYGRDAGVDVLMYLAYSLDRMVLAETGTWMLSPRGAGMASRAAELAAGAGSKRGQPVLDANQLRERPGWIDLLAEV